MYPRHLFLGKTNVTAGTWHALSCHMLDVAACWWVISHDAVILDRVMIACGFPQPQIRDPVVRQQVRVTLAIAIAAHDIGKTDAHWQHQVRVGGDAPPHTGPDAEQIWLRVSNTLPGLPSDQQTPPILADLFRDLNGRDDPTWPIINEIRRAVVEHHAGPQVGMVGEAVSPQGKRLKDPTATALMGRVAHAIIAGAGAYDLPAVPWPHEAWPQTGGALAAVRLPPPMIGHLIMGLTTWCDWMGSQEDDFPRLSQPTEPTDDELQAYWTDAVMRAAMAVARHGLILDDARRRTMLTSAAPAPLEHIAYLRALPNASLATRRGAQDMVMQAWNQVWQQTQPGIGTLAVLEAPTGDGKTEAALMAWSLLAARGHVSGLTMCLPTRTSAIGVHDRVRQMVDRILPGQPVVLAVPGQASARDVAHANQAPEPASIPSRAEADRYGLTGGWGDTHGKRFLANLITVGTTDQAQMGCLRVAHAHLRLAPTTRNLLVIDEYHASDPYQRYAVHALTAAHLAVGGHVLIMTATLTAEAVQQLLTAVGCDRTRRAAQPMPIVGSAMATPYPLLRIWTHQAVPMVGRPVRTPRIPILVQPDPGCIPRVVSLRTDVGCLDAPMQPGLWTVATWETAVAQATPVAQDLVASARRDQRVLSIRTTVLGARVLWDAVHRIAPELLATVGDLPMIHCSAFGREDRLAIDQAIVSTDRRSPGWLSPKRVEHGDTRGGRIVIGTSTLCQSLDIDADTGSIDLRSMDLLIQSLGRYLRHARDGRTHLTVDPVRILVPRPMQDLVDGKPLQPIWYDPRIAGMGWRRSEAQSQSDMLEMVRSLVHSDIVGQVAVAEILRVHGTTGTCGWSLPADARQRLEDAQGNDPQAVRKRIVTQYPHLAAPEAAYQSLNTSAIGIADLVGLHPEKPVSTYTRGGAPAVHTRLGDPSWSYTTALQRTPVMGVYGERLTNLQVRVPLRLMDTYLHDPHTYPSVSVLRPVASPGAGHPAWRVEPAIAAQGTWDDQVILTPLGQVWASRAVGGLPPALAAAISC